jgi:hypothetical protein
MTNQCTIVSQIITLLLRHYCVILRELVVSTLLSWGLGWRSGWGPALLVWRSWDRFPVVSLYFSVTYSFRPFHGPGVDSAPSENEYQEHFLGVKAAGAWGWPHHHVANVMKIWEPKTPGTLWATPGLLRDCFTFALLSYISMSMQLLI